ncbi:MAG: hypothetical protein FWE95_06675 [Planctomycetaceae bacterium]|nr:hypothetical protein [Planctomycetaceae bacterium]
MGLFLHGRIVIPPESFCRTSPEVRALLHEYLDALIDESDLVAHHAAYGQTLNDLEEFYLDAGRKFLKETEADAELNRLEKYT